MASTINATPTSNGLIQSADNSGVLALQTGGTTAVTVDGSQNVGIGTTSPTTKLYVTSTTNRAYATVESTSTTAGPEAGISLKNGNKNFLLFNDYDSSSLNVYDATSAAFRMRIDSSGNLLVDTTDPSINGKGVAINSQAYLGDAYGRINIKKTYSGNVVGVNFSYNNGTVGNITYSNTAVAYNTSSDYRLKDDIAPMSGSLAKVLALKPVTYKWKSDGSNGQGFIAHELQAIVPDCVTGEKDAVETVDELDEDGKVIGTKEVPQYQGIDTSFLVATLTAAIQELNAKVDAQALEIQALKGVA
jgi:hypothetical protein